MGSIIHIAHCSEDRSPGTHTRVKVNDYLLCLTCIAAVLNKTVEAKGTVCTA